MYLRDRWNDFARTRPGDAFATLLTIGVMFGAMFGFALAVMLGADGVQMLLGPH